MKYLICFQLFLLGSLSGYSQQKNDLGYIVKVGQTAPGDFSLKLTDGTTTSLKALRGKVVMLQFTASWCSVCRQEIPHIEKEIWDHYRNKNFVLIGVDRNESMDTVQQYHRYMRVSYPFALDPGADIFGKFALKSAGVTRNILIDPSGRIVYLTRLYDPEEFAGLKAKIAGLLPD